MNQIYTKLMTASAIAQFILVEHLEEMNLREGITERMPPVFPALTLEEVDELKDVLAGEKCAPQAMRVLREMAGHSIVSETLALNIKGFAKFAADKLAPIVAKETAAAKKLAKEKAARDARNAGYNKARAEKIAAIEKAEADKAAAHYASVVAEIHDLGDVVIGEPSIEALERRLRMRRDETFRYCTNVAETIRGLARECRNYGIKVMPPFDGSNVSDVSPSKALKERHIELLAIEKSLRERLELAMNASREYKRTQAMADERIEAMRRGYMPGTPLRTKRVRSTRAA